MHKDVDNEEVILNFSNESDGTQRLIELGPIIKQLISSTPSNDVFIIDELDRSLHTMLTQFIIKTFIEKSGKDTRSQLIFSCHDALLVDLKIFRSDELFVVNKQDNRTQITSMKSLDNIRSDKELINDYLKGFFGGIPKVQKVIL